MKQVDYFSVYIVKVYYLSIISFIVNLFYIVFAFLKKRKKELTYPFKHSNYILSL